MPIAPLSELGKRPLVMGIINATPDSFSGDGVMRNGDHIKAALALAAKMVADGADMLDIGGESSRPGSTPIEAAEEIRRTRPVIESIRAKFPDLPIAIDTVKPAVAEAALAAGVCLINDISALKDVEMVKLAVASGAYVVLMHNRADPAAATQDPQTGGEYHAPTYNDVVADVGLELGARIEAVCEAGVMPDHIIADPGLGFGKTVAQNCALLNRLDKLKARLGCPIMVGPSRKSFIGRVLDLPVEQRLEGTAAAVAIAIVRGADIVRVHDVKEMARVARMAAAIRSS